MDLAKMMRPVDDLPVMLEWH